jgi:Tetratricopeptide repeat/TIR domain
VEPDHDVFVSYPRTDRATIERLARALREGGLRVFVDDSQIDEFQRITTTITTGLACSKALVAYYSADYPTRRACQWELTAAYLAAQRAGDPAERILVVVQPDAALDHLHPGELRDALVGRLPADGDQAGLLELAAAIAKRVRGLPGPLGEVAPLVPARWLPTQGLGSTRFVGRLPEMWRIHSALHPEATRLTEVRTGPAVAQVRGLGGIGKSLLAEEYALRFGAAYPGGVFWLRAYGSHDQSDPSAQEVEARHHDEVHRVAELLGVATGQLSPDQITAAVADRIHQADLRCLWVVDDLPKGLDAHQLRSLLAPHPLACTLFTTRSQAYGALAAVVDLDVLDFQDAYELLTTRRPPTTNEEQHAAQGIVEALGRHALAVDVAGAALASQQGLVSYADFLASLAEPDEDELELISQLADALPNGHEASITRTLLRSTSQLVPEGQDFLRLAASLAPAPIPADLLRAVLQAADGLDQRQAARRAGHEVAQAATLSLASKAAEGDQTGAWLVHALVGRTVRFQETDPQRLTTLRDAAIAVLIDRLQAIVDARTHSVLQAVVPHARELARHPDTTAEAELLTWVARYDYERGDYRPAEQANRQVLEARRRLLGPDHPDTLLSMNNLAMTLRVLGDADGAADLHRQVLDARRRLLGPEHPDTLTSMNNLADTLRVLGDAAGAAELHRQVLDASRRLLGPEHPDTLNSMNNLAETLRALGDAAGARDLLQQAAPASEKLLGPEHPTTRTVAGNLAFVQRALNEPTP